jgi:hypothetical protein
MRRLQFFVVGMVVASWWVLGMAAGAAAQGAPGQPAPVKPLKPFTAEVSALPGKVYWDMDKVRIDMGAFTAGGGVVSPHYTLLFYKTGRIYQVFPGAAPLCSYDETPPAQVGCHNPLSMMLMPLPQASSKTKITVVGEETVAGVRCTVEKITSSDPNVAPPGGARAWISKDLGILVKVESPGPNGSEVFFDNIKLGQPDPKLFVPPAYCAYHAGSAGPCN